MYPGYTFSSWLISGASCSGSSSSNPCTFTMPSNAVSLTANFVAQVQASVLLKSNPSGALFAFAAVYHNDGDTVTIDRGIWLVTVRAAPQGGYVFSSWSSSGALTVGDSNNPVTEVTVSGDGTLTANFARTNIQANYYVNGVQVQNTGDQTRTFPPVTFKVVITQGSVYGMQVIVDDAAYDMTAVGSSFSSPSLPLGDGSHYVQFRYQTSSNSAWGTLGMMTLANQEAGFLISDNWLVVSGVIVALLTAAVVVVWRRRRR